MAEGNNTRVKRSHFPISSSLECQVLVQLFRICETLGRLFHFSEILVPHRQNKIRCLLYRVLVKIRDFQCQVPSYRWCYCSHSVVLMAVELLWMVLLELLV